MKLTPYKINRLIEAAEKKHPRKLVCLHVGDRYYLSETVKGCTVVPVNPGTRMMIVDGRNLDTFLRDTCYAIEMGWVWFEGVVVCDPETAAA